MNLTDTHCHLNLQQFNLDRNEAIQRAWDAGLSRILIPGIDLTSSIEIVQAVQDLAGLFAGLGVHPNDSLTWTSDTYFEFARLVQADKGLPPGSRKIVAIGEIGLDYYWNDAPHQVQQNVLSKQLELAAEFGLPVILHLREQSDNLHGDCAEEILSILKTWVESLHLTGNPLEAAPGVLHSFSGSLQTAQAALDMNFYIGITGPVTYKNAEAKREVVKSLPLDRILIETDSPFLAPVPWRGRRNEPAFVRYVIDKIAEIHHKNPEDIAARTTENAARLFSW